jgi:GDPmannose 4,6-dehydratase
MKRALITGGSGQDGYYLSQLLMDKGYDVYSVVRRSSVDNFIRINKLNSAMHFEVLYGDLTDTSGLLRIISEVGPQEIYNLAAQSDVRISFDIPEYTGDVDGLGTTRLLEAIRSLGMIDSCNSADRDYSLLSSLALWRG